VIRLLELWLNHDTTDADRDGLNIRVNLDREMVLPEWNAGQLVNARPAAAYTRTAGANGPVLLAKFERTSRSTRSVAIKAVQAGAGSNFLGEIPRTVIQFDGSDQTGLVELAPQGVLLDAVGLHDDVWSWEFESGGSWVNFARTELRIYCVLDTPASPWTQSLDDPTQVPWTDVLDHACAWAAGARDVETVAERVTTAAFDLGRNGLVSYYVEDPQPWLCNFSPYVFDCMLFLEVLANPPSPPRRVGCTDCASIVTTFANSLGCDLKQVLLGCFFQPNKIRLIGGRRAEVLAFPFKYHELAWNGEAGEEARVWDSCLMVDGDDQPGIGRFQSMLPVNQRFERAGEIDYRERLVDAKDIGSCAMKPALGNRRLGGRDGAPQLQPCSVVPMMAVRKDGKEESLVPPFKLTGVELTGWSLRAQRSLDRRTPNRWFRSEWESRKDGQVLLLELEYYVEKSEPEGQKRLWDWLEEFEMPVLKEERTGPGETRSVSAGHTVILFRRANVAVALRNDRQYKFSMETVAADFDSYLVSRRR
jgi:hypothetical protein